MRRDGTTLTTLADVQIGVNGKAHWTPRYVYHRVRLLSHDRRNSGDPWLTPEANRLLSSLLRPSDRGAEFGSGRSTLWFAERVAHLTSVEHDPHWYDIVSRQLSERKLANVDYRLEPRDAPEEHGGRSGYARAALRFPDASVDFTLIDGAYRDHTASYMLAKLRPGGLLIIDNVNWYLPSASSSPNSRSHRAGPEGAVWSEVFAELTAWRSIWTTSGVTDTAIFFKPVPGSMAY
jgi:predicted O-methyltransferase YrrM